MTESKERNTRFLDRAYLAICGEKDEAVFIMREKMLWNLKSCFLSKNIDEICKILSINYIFIGQVEKLNSLLTLGWIQLKIDISLKYLIKFNRINSISDGQTRH